MCIRDRTVTDSKYESESESKPKKIHKQQRLIENAQRKQAQSKKIDLINEYIELYNQHDLDNMLNLLSDEVKWMSVSEDKLNIETQGKEELRESLKNYFENIPSARSELLFLEARGDYLQAFEKALWKNKDGEEKSQCASSVYELDGNLIKNIWYYPSFSCE